MGAESSVATQSSLLQRYQYIRQQNERLCEPLETEDFTIAPTPEIGSPVKWHLAHTSWFFETFVLTPHSENYKAFHPKFSYLFNSYYISVGERHTRSLRGSVSRPSVREVFEYRRYVDGQMEAFLESANADLINELEPVIEIGLQHEQQHQELILSDIKHIFWNNPTYPRYLKSEIEVSHPAPPIEWVGFEAGMQPIGHNGDGFAFDNEQPRHEQYVHSFELASRLVTNGEFLEFVEDDGYERGKFWLDLGWDTVCCDDWKAPFYWEFRDGQWHEMTLHGLQPLDLNKPVSHVSYLEADAYARWASARLATESEWETAARDYPIEGNFQESALYHPQALSPDSQTGALHQLYGDLWEWTQSHYSPYRGYRPPEGSLGEYNGKFMCNMFVLRGGACVTPKSHIRLTYRNFFGPDKRWPFTGIRLARDL